jgi:hypothetical protein
LQELSDLTLFETSVPMRDCCWWSYLAQVAFALEEVGDSVSNTPDLFVRGLDHWEKLGDLNGEI